MLAVGSACLIFPCPGIAILRLHSREGTNLLVEVEQRERIAIGDGFGIGWCEARRVPSDIGDANRVERRIGISDLRLCGLEPYCVSYCDILTGQLNHRTRSSTRR